MKSLQELNQKTKQELRQELAAFYAFLGNTPGPHAEKTLLELPANYREMFMHAPYIVMEVNANKVYTWANLAGINFFGPDVLGKESSHYYRDSIEVNALVDKFLDQQDELVYVESLQQRKDGEKRLLGWWCRVIKDNNNKTIGALSIAHDITEARSMHYNLKMQIDKRTSELYEKNQELHLEIEKRKLIENELRISENNYRTLTSLYPVGIFHLDIAGNCTYINQRCSEMLGLSFEKARDNGWMKSIHPDDLGQLIQDFAVAKNKNIPLKVECRFLQPSGQIRQVHAEVIAERTSKGKICGYIGTATDITKLRETERQLEIHQGKLSNLTRLNAVGEMAVAIAHQLNQPLTAVVHYTGGCLEHLRNNKNPQDLRVILERIMSQAERAGAIIHNLKDFLQKGKAHKEPISINDTITQACTFVKTRLENSHIRLNLELDTNLAKVDADRLHIEHALINILINAIDVLRDQQQPERNITVSSRYHPKGANAVQIIIHNNGPEIAVALQHKIFDHFYTTKKDGMGMGLAIASSIIENHGGTITVNSSAMDGTSFTLTIPLAGDKLQCLSKAGKP